MTISRLKCNFSLPGTFARVCLCRDRASREYFALKILAIHDVIRLKQIEHVKNEKSILKVSNTITILISTPLLYICYIF